VSGTAACALRSADPDDLGRVLSLALPRCSSHTGRLGDAESAGLAVFSGMIGVTIFGIFLTPVFYVVIDAQVAGRVFARSDCSVSPRRLCTESV